MTDTTYKHYSTKPIESVFSVSQTLHPDMKPKGFWVSVGTAWRDWCYDNEFGLDRFLNEYDVALNDSSNILFIGSDDSLFQFNQVYGTNRLPGISHNLGFDFVKWNEVAEKYQGIIINPYSWAHRHRMLWYYGWDCASGCIWDAAAIDSITLVKEAEQIK